jgi:hypothetical protein
MPTGFHPHKHLCSLRPELTIELFRFLRGTAAGVVAVLLFLYPQKQLAGNPGDHRILSDDLCSAPYLPSILVGCTTKVCSGVGADIVMESITPTHGQVTANPDLIYAL